MVETKDLEICAIEIGQFTPSVAGNFVQGGMKYLALLEQGNYVGIYSKDKGRIITGRIYQGGV